MPVEMPCPVLAPRGRYRAPFPARAAAALLALLTGLAACGKAPEPPKTPLAAGPRPGGEPGDASAAAAGAPLSPAARASLDSGNVLLRGGDATGALARYRAAAAATPDNATPWYGVLMAAQRLGNASLADTARRKVAQLSGNPDLADSGLQAIHGGTAGGAAGGLPPGHPGAALPPGHPQTGTPPGHPPIGRSGREPVAPRPTPKKTR